MCGNCNCGRGSVFCLDERMIFIVLLILLFTSCGGTGLFSGLLGGSCGGGSCGCGCRNNGNNRNCDNCGCDNCGC